MMDPEKTGALIRTLRLKHAMTQLQLAEKLQISDKTVSKWECGSGLPDIGLIEQIAAVFSIEPKTLLQGELPINTPNGGNMKRICIYSCPHCGNIITSAAKTAVSCCGHTLSPLSIQKADETHAIQVADEQDEWYITTKHPMEKGHYLSAIFYIMQDRMMMMRLYPEQELELYLPKIRKGKILFLCNKDGLFEQ